MGDIKVPSFEELMLQILRLMSDDKQSEYSNAWEQAI